MYISKNLKYLEMNSESDYVMKGVLSLLLKWLFEEKLDVYIKIFFKYILTSYNINNKMRTLKMFGHM